jgi:ferrous iron transport protein B
MTEGKSFPERIKIMLPPNPDSEKSPEKPSANAAAAPKEKPLYVNLLKSKETETSVLQSLQTALEDKANVIPATVPPGLAAAASPVNPEPPDLPNPEVFQEKTQPQSFTAEVTEPFKEPEPTTAPMPTATHHETTPLIETAAEEKVALHPKPSVQEEPPKPAAKESAALETVHAEPPVLQSAPAPATSTANASTVADLAHTPAHTPSRIHEEDLKSAVEPVPAPAPAQETAPPVAAQTELPAPEGLSSSRRIAVTGNPNCGKSTLFNALTGLRQKVGNYPGVTVEKKEGSFYGSHGEPMQLLDLPGCYSLQARSPDEAVARDVLLGRQADTPRPDAVLAVLDATNLERNLYLLSQLLELGLPVFLGLNMLDLAEKRGIVIDPRILSEKLGIPVLPLVASEGVGLIGLKQALSQPTLPLPKLRPPLPEPLEQEAHKLANLLPRNGAEYAEAVLLLGMPESQLELTAYLSPEQRNAITQARQRLVDAGMDPVSAAVDARYQWIGTVISDSQRHEGESGLSLSDKLDRVLTHKFWGWLAFLGAMALVFFSIFTIAKIPADWIASGQAFLGDWLQTVMPEGDFRSLVIDGVLAGVTGVLIFLPQILILTFFLGLLEDTGYMARAAFLMDRLMSRVGLHGKSFIPMLSSFACAIPGIMATRTIEQRKDRLVTILVSPLMSCSARLPVYTLLISVLLPDVSIWKKAAIMLSMYVLGVLAAFVMAGIFKKTLLRSETPVLLMEMPPYRKPSMRGILMRMLERAWIFLKRAGTVILALSVLLWALTTYPKPADPEAKGSERIAHSVAGRLGKAIEPVIAPLGFDWKIGIGLIGSFAAREVFVSTMGIVYSIENSGDETPITALSETMRGEKRPDGTDVYTPLTGTALMVFYVLAMQCLSTLAVVRRETNSWKWPAFQLVYMTLLAYAGALLVFQGGRLLGWH